MQADLYDWIPVLDRLDDELESSLKDDLTLLCIQPEENAGNKDDAESKTELVAACLNFSVILLKHSINKHVYNSLEVCYKIPE